MRSLLAVLLLAQPASEMPVYLNHFYITVDPATYASILSSDFLRTRFAPFELRTTVRTDSTYTGAYFYGRNTYFEFFDSGKEHRVPGDSALAFGVEQTGGLDTLSRLMAASGEVTRERRTREIDGRPVQWFSQLAFNSMASGSTGIRSFIMEYDAQFLQDWHRDASRSDGTIRRANILRRYIAVLPQTPAAPLLEDVVAIRIAADRYTASLLARQLTAFGYTSGANNTVFSGPDFTLYIVDASQTMRGVQSVTFRTAGAPDLPGEFTFGARSKLKFTGAHSAEWTF